MSKLITDSDYTHALERYSRLRKKETLSFEERDELVQLFESIKRYESSDNVSPVDPIKLIELVMEEKGLKRRDLEPLIGTRGNVSEVMNKVKPLSLPMMRRLSAELDIPIQLLTPEYDLKKKDNLEFTQSLIKTIFERQYLSTKDSLERFCKGAPDKLEDYIKKSLGLRTEPALLRTSLHYQSEHKRTNKKMDVAALLLWQARVTELASNITTLNQYIPERLNKSNIKEIAQLSRFDNGPQMAREELSRYGIKLVICKHLPKTYLDGAVLPDKNGSPIIALTLRYDRIDNFWHVLLHELSHVVAHFETNSKVFVDDLDSKDSSDIEREADMLALEAVMTDEQWDSYFPFMHSQESVTSIAGQLKISPALVAGRYRKEVGDFKKFNRLIGNKMIRKLFEEYEHY
ncbi:ImmA/IrrE family metallo-endopeptidase [Alteromonadaceae bacterium M269]|jgi:HTH-type transcriptional regulator/antitoxin HigA|nr:ImmA/IrrE family metallo-endopeptidase [Alteromonadaceae bacterium M269]